MICFTTNCVHFLLTMDFEQFDDVDSVSPLLLILGDQL